jgi:hypothetical protein
MLLVSTAIQSGALRKNHTSGIPHLAGSTQDVGAADHSESVAAGLRTCRLDVPWLNIGAVALAQRQSYSDYNYSEGDKLD